MSDYDDTDKCLLWKPRTDQVLRAIGKVNNKGEENNTLLMACQTKDGEKYYELYQKLSISMKISVLKHKVLNLMI